MARILILLPQQDFDPTETAVPWKAWTEARHDVAFATETGAPAVCDRITLTGDGLPFLAKSLRARPDNVALYGAMTQSPAFQSPSRWCDVKAADYAAIHFPGGHAAGMRRYCDSKEVARLAKEAFAAKQPVSAICHGVLPLARAGVLKGRKTTALTGKMEGFAILLTSAGLGDHYRTYPQSVQEEVVAALAKPSDFDAGPLLPRYATREKPEAGFVVEDGHYLSARWPGDAWTLATRLLQKL